MSATVREMPVFLDPAPAAGARPAAAGPPSPAPVRAPRPHDARIPGEAGLWVFLLGDMTMFGVFFAAFLVQRGQDPATFAAGWEQLATTAGAANTLLLLTSSLLVAVAVRAVRLRRRTDARRLLVLAAACGTAFAAIKVGEWVLKASAGHGPGADLFFTYYFLLTGVHFLHLLIGLAALAFWWRLLGRTADGADAADPSGEARAVGCCASYWHMVDLLWIVLFPVLYLAAT